MIEILWVVQNHPQGKRVIIYDGKDTSAPVISNEVMSKAEYDKRRTSTGRNKLVKVRFDERGS